MSKQCWIALLLLSCCHQLHAQSPNVDSLLQVVQHAPDDTNKVIACRMLTGLLKSTEPLKAAEYGKTGAALGIRLGWDKGIAGCLLNTSAAYTAAGKLDTAMSYIDSAILYSYKAGDPNRLALAYLNRADINMQLQNLGGSLRDCDSSLQYAEKADNDDRRARVIQTIGSVYFLQQLYPESARYYDRAYQLYQKIGNQQMSAIVLNNQGNVYKQLQDYKKATAVFLQAIAIGKSINDQNNLSMYHENLADVYLQDKQLPLAAQYGDLAMQYAEEQQNDLQLANAWENLGRIYLAKKQYNRAIEAGLRAMDYAAANDLITQRHEASDLLANAYTAGGQVDKANYYLVLNKAINDSLLRQQFDADIAAMQTRFKVQEKDNMIRLLEDNNLLQQQKLQQQRLLLMGSVLLSLLVLGGIGLLINRYRLKQRMEKLALRNRIAADLHDEVGSSLSSIYMLSQMLSANSDADPRQQEMLSKMSVQAGETVDKMSDIVWMIKPGSSDLEDLPHRMTHFAYGLCESQRMNCEINLQPMEGWKLDTNDRRNIYLVFKEAMNNAAKYSGTAAISVMAGEEGKMRWLQVSDDGAGFDSSIKTNGNGLTNMQNRAQDMQGRLELTSTPGKGTTVRLLFPA